MVGVRPYHSKPLYYELTHSDYDEISQNSGVIFRTRAVLKLIRIYLPATRPKPGGQKDRPQICDGVRNTTAARLPIGWVYTGSDLIYHTAGRARPATKKFIYIRNTLLYGRCRKLVRIDASLNSLLDNVHMI